MQKFRNDKNRIVAVILAILLLAATTVVFITFLSVAMAQESQASSASKTAHIITHFYDPDKNTAISSVEDYVNEPSKTSSFDMPIVDNGDGTSSVVVNRFPDSYLVRDEPFRYEVYQDYASTPDNNLETGGVSVVTSKSSLNEADQTIVIENECLSRQITIPVYVSLDDVQGEIEYSVKVNKKINGEKYETVITDRSMPWEQMISLKVFDDGEQDSEYEVHAMQNNIAVPSFYSRGYVNVRVPVIAKDVEITIFDAAAAQEFAKESDTSLFASVPRFFASLFPAPVHKDTETKIAEGVTTETDLQTNAYSVAAQSDDTPWYLIPGRVYDTECNDSNRPWIKEDAPDWNSEHLVGWGDLHQCYVRPGAGGLPIAPEKTGSSKPGYCFFVSWSKTADKPMPNIELADWGRTASGGWMGSASNGYHAEDWSDIAGMHFAYSECAGDNANDGPGHSIVTGYKIQVYSVDYNTGLCTYYFEARRHGDVDYPHQNKQTAIGYFSVYHDLWGWIELNKTLMNPDTLAWTLENENYTFEGAQYGVFKDAACTNQVDTITVDANGYGKSGDLKKGEYYVKEIKPPSGYNGAGGYAINTEVVRTVVESGKTTSERGPETVPTTFSSPAGYGFGIEKMDYDRYVDSDGNSPQGATDLIGAKYRVTYYDEYLTTPEQCRSAAPWEHWKSTIITTKLVNGRAIASFSKSGIIEAGSISGGHVTYVDTSGDVTLPVGTYLVEEVSAPKGYHLSKDAIPNKGYVLQAVRSANGQSVEVRAMNANISATSGLITKTGSDVLDSQFNNTIISLDAVKRSDVSINKYIEDTTDPDLYPDKKVPAAGIQFQIVNNNDTSVRRVNVPSNRSHAEKWAAKGEVIYTLTTNDDGWCSTSTVGNVINQTGQSSGSLPLGNYTIKEVDGTQPDGYDFIDSHNFTISYNKKGDCVLDCCTHDNQANVGTGGDRHYVFNDVTGTVIYVAKVDRDTHKQVRGETQFQVLDRNKNVMTFDLPYPQNGNIDTFTTDLNGVATLPDKFMPGTYYIHEVKGPNGYLWSSQDIPFTCTTQTVKDHGKYENPMRVEFPDETAMGVIELTKADSRTGKPIIKASATYGVYAKEDIITPDGTTRATRGTQVDTITTAIGTGVGTSKPLYFGEYYVQEITPPDQYLKDPDKHSVTVSYANDRTPVTVNKITVVNDSPYGKIGVEKRDAESHKLIPEAGVTFDIYAAENIIGGDGHIYHHKGDKIETITTEETGRAMSSRDYVLGKYEAIETVAPRGYSLNKTPIPLEVKYADAETPQVQAWGASEDNPQTFELELAKLDRETGNVVPLSNTVIEMRAAENIYKTEGSLVHEKDKIVDTVMTDETGKVKTGAKDIVCGHYYLKELKAPNGYILDAERPYYIQLSWEEDGRAVAHASATISDVPAKGIISFRKADAETGETVKVAGCRAEVYANENIVTPDGTIRAENGAKVADLVTDETGCAQTGELYLGSYRVVETFAPEGYLFNPDPVNVVLQYADENTPVVSAASRIADENAKGVIEVTKKDKETGKIVPLPGAVFEIRAKTDIITGDGTKRASAGDVVGMLTTDGSGTCVSDPLYLGMYTVQEIKAPYGYTLDPNVYDAPVVYKDQHTPITTTSNSIENVPQKGVISVTKTDAETGKTVLEAGAEFTVVAAADIVTPDGTTRAREGEVVDTIMTDDSGIAKTKALYLGTYKISETKAPEGYLLSDEVKEVTLTYGDQNEPLVYEMTSLADQPVKGRVTVTKEDSDLDEPLANVEYEIRAAEDVTGKDGTEWYKQGDVAETIVTGEDGIATSKDLPLGEYVVVETVQPNGYELDTKEYQVHLRYKDQLTEIVHSDHVLYNTPSSLFVEKVSTHDPSKVLAQAQFVGWNKSDEVKDQPNFAVFTGQEYEIVKAQVDYLGPLTNEVTADDAKIVSSFALTKELAPANGDANDAAKNAEGAAADENASGGESASGTESAKYVVYSSKEKAAQGSYVMHLIYKHNNKHIEEAFKFVINENDANAVFALGNIVQDKATQMGNCFGSHAVFADEKTSDDGNSKPVEGGDENAAGGETNDEADIPSEDRAAASDSDAGDGSADTETKDELAADNDGESTDDGVGSGDANGNSTGSSAKDDGKDVVADIKDASDVAKRVPVVLSCGAFAHSVTGDNGLAEFKYVQQGEIGFAEYVPPVGYASDRTPRYITFSLEGTPTESDTTAKISLDSNSENLLAGEAPDASSGENAGAGNEASNGEDVVVGKNEVIGLRFADEEIKLSISKRDITSSEELPGNVLSVYTSLKDDTIGTDGEIDSAEYGELIETWTSTNEPHMMELLPQGTYILKEEQAVDGYSIAEDIMFQLNDTGVVQQVVMNNDHEAGLASELIEPLVETGIPLPVVLVVMFVGSVVFAIGYRKRDSIATALNRVCRK